MKRILCTMLCVLVLALCVSATNDTMIDYTDPFGNVVSSSLSICSANDSNDVFNGLSCNHPHSLFFEERIDIVYGTQMRDTDCPDSEIRFLIYRCSVCGTEKYRANEIDFSGRKLHNDYRDSRGICTRCLHPVNYVWPND